MILNEAMINYNLYFSGSTDSEIVVSLDLRVRNMYTIQNFNVLTVQIKEELGVCSRSYINYFTSQNLLLQENKFCLQLN